MFRARSPAQKSSLKPQSEFKQTIYDETFHCLFSEGRQSGGLDAASSAERKHLGNERQFKKFMVKAFTFFDEHSACVPTNFLQFFPFLLINSIQNFKRMPLIFGKYLTIKHP